LFVAEAIRKNNRKYLPVVQYCITQQDETWPLFEHPEDNFSEICIQHIQYTVAAHLTEVDTHVNHQHIQM
jgi:hypothetical protein